MSDRERPSQTDDEDTPTRDPDLGSTWNTIDGTARADDLLNDEDFENLLMEPTTGELGILSDTDVPGEPG